MLHAASLAKDSQERGFTSTSLTASWLGLIVKDPDSCVDGYSMVVRLFDVQATASQMVGTQNVDWPQRKHYHVIISVFPFFESQVRVLPSFCQLVFHTHSHGIQFDLQAVVDPSLTFSLGCHHLRYQAPKEGKAVIATAGQVQGHAPMLRLVASAPNMQLSLCSMKSSSLLSGQSLHRRRTGLWVVFLASFPQTCVCFLQSDGNTHHTPQYLHLNYTKA